MQTIHSFLAAAILGAGILASSACSHQEPPKPAAKPTVASAFGGTQTVDASATASVSAPQHVAPPDNPGQAAFGPGPHAGAIPGPQPKIISPNAATRMSDLRAKADARAELATKRQATTGDTPPPALPPTLDRSH